MLKKMAAAVVAFCTAASVFAYNPPFGGENIYSLTNPEMLSGSGSASGGPVFTVVPASITVNPALTALEQRSVVNLSATLFFDTNASDGNSDAGFGFQTGIMIPTKYLVFDFTGQGVFMGNPAFDLGKSLAFHTGVSKEVSSRLFVGVDTYFGFYFGENDNFVIGADLGGVYRFDRDFGFLKDPRIGVALLNMGKPLNGSYGVTGINGTREGTSYPGIFTPRASFAAELFNVKEIAGAFSTDLAFPSFQNMIFDFEFKSTYKDFLQLNVGWNCNVRELANGGKVSWPSVGVNFKFGISSDSEKIKDNWKKSEIVPSVAWQNMNGGIQALSAGASLYLGLEDRDAPVILLWDESPATDLPVDLSDSVQE